MSNETINHAILDEQMKNGISDSAIKKLDEWVELNCDSCREKLSAYIDLEYLFEAKEKGNEIKNNSVYDCVKDFLNGLFAIIDQFEEFRVEAYTYLKEQFHVKAMKHFLEALDNGDINPEELFGEND